MADRRERWRRARRIARRTLVTLLVLATTVVLGQRRLLYNNWGPFRAFPPGRPVEVEETWLTTADGVRLRAYWAPCPASLPSCVPGPRPVVLFCHGNSGTLPRWRWVAARWQ